MNNNCLFPTITIDVTGPQGNAYCIMGIICNLLKEIGYTKEQINDIVADMTSSDYEHLINVARKYVVIKGYEEE